MRAQSLPAVLWLFLFSFICTALPSAAQSPPLCDLQTTAGSPVGLPSSSVTFELVCSVQPAEITWYENFRTFNFVTNSPIIGHGPSITVLLPEQANLRDSICAFPQTGPYRYGLCISLLAVTNPETWPACYGLMVDGGVGSSPYRLLTHAGELDVRPSCSSDHLKTWEYTQETASEYTSVASQLGFFYVGFNTIKNPDHPLPAAENLFEAWRGYGIKTDSPLTSNDVSVIVASAYEAGLPPDPPWCTGVGCVVEYYNSELDHYFITADLGEQQVLDTGKLVGWKRTGWTFHSQVVADNRDPAALASVCRYYIPPALGDSHFFSADVNECGVIPARFPSFVLESSDAFNIFRPDEKTGSCGLGAVSVYRLWNGRADSNHRYVTDRQVRYEMMQKGYVSEGYGVDGVVMCSP
jgi:hypothetical protein